LFIKRLRLPGFGLIEASIGIGVVFGALIIGIAKNPSLRGQLFAYAILGFALMITFMLYTLKPQSPPEFSDEKFEELFLSISLSYGWVI
jgi:hypothetical protein